MSSHRLMWVIEIRKFMVALGGVHPKMFGLCLNETHFLWPLKWVYIVSKKIAHLLCQIDDEEEREGAKHYLASTWRMNPSPCVDKTHIPHKIAFPCIAPLGFDPRTFGLWANTLPLRHGACLVTTVWLHYCKASRHAHLVCSCWRIEQKVRSLSMFYTTFENSDLTYSLQLQ